MGMGIVFVGLICIILICMAASAIIRAMESGSKTEAISQYAGAAAAPAAPASELTPEKRREMIAAVSAAFAEVTKRVYIPVQTLSLGGYAAFVKRADKLGGCHPVLVVRPLLEYPAKLEYLSFLF